VADAQVLDARGQLLARWQRPETGLFSRLEMQIAKAFLEKPINLPIIHQDRQIGSILLTGHGGSLMRFLLSGLAGIVLCTAISAWVAFSLARRQLRGITGPLRNLASVAHAVRSERAFDRRVPAALPNSTTWATTSMPCSTSWNLANPPAKRKRDPRPPGQPRQPHRVAEPGVFEGG
jgi:hypothetical protein